MYPRSSLREKRLVAAWLVFLGGFGGLIVLDNHPSPSHIHGILRTIAACGLLFGWLTGHAMLFVRRWDRNPGIRAIHRNRDGLLWLRITAVVLWVGVLPLACLWVYHYTQHLRP